MGFHGLDHGGKPSKPINPAFPLGPLLAALQPHALMPYLQTSKVICLCSQIWPQYNLEGNCKWPPNGTFDPDILWELSNYCQHTGKWKEILYIQGFFYVSSKVDPSVLAHCSPVHMFLAMPSAPEELSTSAMDPAIEPPPFWARETTPPTSSQLLIL